MQRRMREVLATASGQRKAARREQHKRCQGWHDQAFGRNAAGDLQRPPAVHVPAGLAARSDTWPGPDGLRRSLVCAVSGRQPDLPQMTRRPAVSNGHMGLGEPQALAHRAPRPPGGRLEPAPNRAAGQGPARSAPTDAMRVSAVCEEVLRTPYRTNTAHQTGRSTGASAIAEKSERKPGYAGPTPADLAPRARRAAGHAVRLSPTPVGDGTKTWRTAQCGGESSERAGSRARSSPISG